MLSVDGQRMVSCSSYNVADGQGMVSCSSYSVADGFSRSGGTHVVYVAVFSTGWALFQVIYDTVSDHLESLSTSVPEILTACRLNGQCCGLYG